MRIAMAGNTLAPAYSALLQKGYTVERHPELPDCCVASKNGYSFLADNPVELLGLIAMIEVRGEAWQASDREVEDFLQHLA
ncbi:hypothetical protein [Lysobacter capsici]|uniref:hypothetical protein n=1 Tax=Lysobacter capsici TaxID=435897 RepID=UPI000ADA8506|nr:hypothetical protein [Lysobacter capsici]